MYTERASRVPGAVLWRGAGIAPVRVLPDGCMDLMVLGGRIVVAGPDTRALVAPTTGVITALRLPPGTAPYLLGLPAIHLRDARPELAELGLAHRPDPAVTAGDPAGLERWVLTLADAAETPRWPAEALRLLRGGNRVDRIARELGWSVRALHRNCLFAFGYGPATLRRIVRFQRAVAAADTGRALAAVAASAGYADQAHLARDARELAGVSMSELVRERRADQLSSGA